MSQPVNTSIKNFTLLVEYSTLTGQPTGRIKPNIPSDPNYITPVVDLISCPTDSTPIPTSDILVTLLDFTVNVRLQFSTAHIDRNTNGIWTVNDRTYDILIFQITAATSNLYKLRIEYDGTFKEIESTGTGNIAIPGPFIHITKISIISVDGDFNNDYNDDYKI